ncbi:MAG: hypothetical protein ACRDY0_00470 [Acidimicrobiales bacterium]
MVLAAGLAATAVVACGSASPTSGPTPSQTVNNALAADFNQGGLMADVSLDTTPAILMARSSTLSAAQAHEILSSHLVVSTHAMGTATLAAQSAGATSEVSLQSGTSVLADIRFIGSELYARADIAGISQAYGLNKGTVASFRQALTRAAGRIPAAAALANDKWVSLNLSAALQALGGQFGLGGSTSTTNPELGAQLAAGLQGIFAHTAKVANAGDHYVVTFQDRALLSQVAGLLSSTPALSVVPGVGSLSQAANTVSSKKTTMVDVVVSNNHVTQLRLPLGQFDAKKAPSGTDDVVVNLGAAGAIVAPASSTALKPQQLLQLLTG